MKTRIYGTIGIVWGGGIIFYSLFSTPNTGSAAYQSGGIAGLLFGAIFFVVGLYYFLKKQKPR